VPVRVEPEELGSIRNRVVKDGDRYGGDDLAGAVMDCDFALLGGGFTNPDVTETGDVERMVLYVCRPDWDPTSVDEVAQRLEKRWLEQGAFKHEAHSITLVRDVVALDFVTWWDGGAFYTGRIEVRLPELGP